VKVNLGSRDKTIRIAVSIIITTAFLTGTMNGIISIIGLIITGLLITTSFISFCPFYYPFGINTKKKLNDKVYYNFKNQNPFS